MPVPEAKVSAAGFRTWGKRRGHCPVTGCHSPFVEPHHVRTRGAMGTSDPEKADPENVVFLCRWHHSIGDSPGWSWKRFESSFKIDLKAVAALTWRHWCNVPEREREIWAKIESGRADREDLDF